ncbi:MAG: hypothetical protein ABIH41_04845 [Nanoarchaeota archaeon]
MKAAYIGRLQTVHKGHLSVIKYIAAAPDVDRLVIMVGSSQYDRHNKSIEAPLVCNPFTYAEREGTIRAALDGEVDKPLDVVAIQDQHDHQRWANYVLLKLGKGGVIYTNSRSERAVFDPLGVECRTFPVRDQYHAQIIREMMANGDDWQSMVPDGAAKYITEQGLDKIVRRLHAEHPDEITRIHERDKARGVLTYDEAITQLRGTP